MADQVWPEPSVLLGIWLTPSARHGADIHLENYRGFSPYDLALPWLQKQLKDERDNFLREQKKKLKEGTPALPSRLSSCLS